MNIENFRRILLKHSKEHPSLQPADVIKLCYQATFGAEHLLTDKDRAKKYFFAEYDSVSAEDTPLFEEISEDYCRIYLSAVKFFGISPEAVFDTFFLTANEKSGNSDGDLWEILSEATELSEKGFLPFGNSEFEKSLSDYKAHGGGPVHHSDEYRAAEHPAYRVVAKKYADGLLKEKNND